LVRSNEAIGVSKAFVHIWIQLMPKEVLKKKVEEIFIFLMYSMAKKMAGKGGG